jgi:RHS repeat-associated protein
VRLHYYNAGGTLLASYTDLGSFTGNTTTSGQTVSGTFTVPATATSMKISLSSALTAGTLTIGSVTLSQTPVVTKYYFAGTQRVAMRQGNTLYYWLTDQLGSTSLTANSSGVVISELRYKPWGEVRYTSGVTATKYQFTGQYSYASDFGLLFYNSRMYDPALGRFTSADTIVPGGVQGWDRYAYVNNSPINYPDPSGHRACDDYATCKVEREYSKLTAIDSWKKIIKDKFGITMSDDGGKNWDLRNIFLAYSRLSDINELLSWTLSKVIVIERPNS